MTRATVPLSTPAMITLIMRKEKKMLKRLFRRICGWKRRGRASRERPKRVTIDSKAQKLIIAQLKNFWAYDGSEQPPIDENKL